MSRLLDNADTEANPIESDERDRADMVRLVEYEELSHAEIATILNCTAKAVETRLYRARNQLKTVLNRLLQ